MARKLQGHEVWQAFTERAVTYQSNFSKEIVEVVNFGGLWCVRGKQGESWSEMSTEKFNKDFTKVANE